MVGKEFRSNYSQILWISRLFLCDGLLFSYCMKTLLVKKHFSSVELTDFFFSLISPKSDAKINTTRVLIFVWKKLLFLLDFFFPLFRMCNLTCCWCLNENFIYTTLHSNIKCENSSFSVVFWSCFFSALLLLINFYCL